jgi:hypothetical protein
MINEKVIISLILCSRNDSYMGNSRWRLETSINLALHNAKKAGFLEQLEIIVSDWGSEIPLQDVLQLVPEAEGRVKFIHTPNDIAIIEQKDSKFPEVIALNAAARRASGEYIGRIDNDTIVGVKFFRKFAKLHQKNPTDELDLKDSFLFVERRSVPYRISRLSLPLSLITAFINFFRGFFKIESAREWGREFWWSPVGIMMFHRDIWQSTQGYDEKLIYWGWMEGDLALRLGQKHQVVEFSKFVGHDFYHLEHYSNLVEYKDRNGTATPRKKNPVITENLNYKTNDPNWGLFDHDLKAHPYKANSDSEISGEFLLPSLKLLWGCSLLAFDFLTLFVSDSKSFIYSSFRILTGKIRQKVIG